MVSGRLYLADVTVISSSATEIPFFTLSLASDSVLENAGFVTALISPTLPPPNDVVVTLSTSPFTATGNSMNQRRLQHSLTTCDIFLMQIQLTTLGWL